MPWQVCIWLWKIIFLNVFINFLSKFSLGVNWTINCDINRVFLPSPHPPPHSQQISSLIDNQLAWRLSRSLVHQADNHQRKVSKALMFWILFFSIDGNTIDLQQKVSTHGYKSITLPSLYTSFSYFQNMLNISTLLYKILNEKKKISNIQTPQNFWFYLKAPE